MSGRLAGKAILITGAARGQGAEEARLFAREGAKLALSDVLSEEVEKLAGELQAAGHDAFACTLDVTSDDDWAAAVAETEKRLGGLNVLVNNAGILESAGVEETSREVWDRVIAVNQTGTWLGMKAVLPAMRRAGGGSIINVSSIFGLVGSGGAAAYHATKGAVRLLTKTAAIQYAPDGIRINSVHPGYIDTPMLRDALPEGMAEQADEAIAAATPLARLGTPSDIAYGVLYLASDESSYVTGSELVIDGGVTAR